MVGLMVGSMLDRCSPNSLILRMVGRSFSRVPRGREGATGWVESLYTLLCTPEDPLPCTGRDTKQGETFDPPLVLIVS